MQPTDGRAAAMSDTILWQRLDRPGAESARLVRAALDWHLFGTAVFTHKEAACRLDYEIVCDAHWRTRAATVTGWVGDALIDLEIAVDRAGGHWRLTGRDCPDVAGCMDLDLNFSPSTNLLPIRRLRLAVGDSATVRAAWLRFPSFTFEPLEQVYRRTGPTTYRYESAGGDFVRDLEVDGAGFVTRYPGFWEVPS
jgi:uncharacterized protein